MATSRIRSRSCRGRSVAMRWNGSLAVLTRAATSFSDHRRPIHSARPARGWHRRNRIRWWPTRRRRVEPRRGEQLYLCLRLALAAEFGKLALPLPW